MEKLLKELIKELKDLNKELSKQHKEKVNYMAFQSQIQKSILNKLIDLERRQNGDTRNDELRNS